MGFINYIAATSQFVYDYADRTLCYLEGGRFQNVHQLLYDRHLANNIYLRALGSASVVDYINTPRNFTLHSLDFQVNPAEIVNFQGVYHASAYNYRFHWWTRKVIALPAVGFKVIQAIFFNFLMCAYQFRSYPVQLTSRHWLFMSKCDLYMAWGYLSILWDSQKGLERVHRGALEKWNASSLCSPMSYETRAAYMINAQPSDHLKAELKDKLKKSSAFRNSCDKAISFLTKINHIGKGRQLTIQDLEIMSKHLNDEFENSPQDSIMDQDLFLKTILDSIFAHRSKSILSFATKIVCKIKNEDKRKREWVWLCNALERNKNSLNYKFFFESLGTFSKFLSQNEIPHLLQLHFQVKELPTDPTGNSLVGSEKVMTIFTKIMITQGNKTLTYLLLLQKHKKFMLPTKDLYINIFARSFCYQHSLDETVAQKFTNELISLKNKKNN